jgi:hypothetical protein
MNPVSLFCREHEHLDFMPIEDEWNQVTRDAARDIGRMRRGLPHDTGEGY